MPFGFGVHLEVVFGDPDSQQAVKVVGVDIQNRFERIQGVLEQQRIQVELTDTFLIIILLIF